MYKYKRPKGKRMSISRKLHNEYLPTRKISFIKSLFVRYDYYVSDSGITIEKLIRLSGKLYNTLLIPFYILTVGVPDTYDEIKKMWWQKKYGSFSVDHIGTYSKDYERFFNLVKKS